MSFITWIKSCFSHRGKALSLYRRGMAKAKKRDYNGAITDYSAAIREPHFPADVKAMAIYNRALAYSAIHEDARAVEDREAVLEMPGSPVSIGNYAQERWDRIRQRDEKGTKPAEQRKRGYR